MGEELRAAALLATFWGGKMSFARGGRRDGPQGLSRLRRRRRRYLVRRLLPAKLLYFRFHGRILHTASLSPHGSDGFPTLACFKKVQDLKFSIIKISLQDIKFSSQRSKITSKGRVDFGSSLRKSAVSAIEVIFHRINCSFSYLVCTSHCIHIRL